MPSKKSNLDVIKFSFPWQPHDKQRVVADAIEAGARVVLFTAGVRSGKTFWLLVEGLKQIYKYQRKPNLGWVVSPTYDMSTVAERKFVELCNLPDGGSLIVRHIASERAYLLTPPPSMAGGFYRVEFKTAIEPKHLRGRSIAWVLLDEAAAMKNGGEVFTTCQARVLDSNGVILIASSPTGQNWMYHDVYLRTMVDPDWVHVNASTYDNPYLPQDEIAKLEEHYKRSSEAFARQEIHGSFEAFEGQAFTRFDPNENIIAPVSIPDCYQIVCGIDWGQNDPFVCVWLAKVDGCWIVIDEYYRAHGLNSEHYNYLNRHPLAGKVRRYWCDPSNSQQRREFKALGLQNLYMARRPKNDPRQEWPVARARLINSMFASRVKSPFGEGFLPGLTLFDTIRNGRREIQSLCYEKYSEEIKDPKTGKAIGIRVTDKSGSALEKNAKERLVDCDNHFVDALGYALFSECRTGPEISPFYWSETQGKTVVLGPKEKKEETHRKMMREQLWDALEIAKRKTRRSGEPYDPLANV